MQRLKTSCHCCGQLVELMRDHISGPDHYRCGNCFEIIDLDELDQLAALNQSLNHIEEERNALLTAHRQRRR